MGEIHNLDSNDPELSNQPGEQIRADGVPVDTIAQDQSEPLGVRIFTYSIIVVIIGIVLYMIFLLATLKDS